VTIEPFNFRDLKLEDARAAYRGLGSVISSLEYCDPDDREKLRFSLANAAAFMSRLAAALCLIQPKERQS